MQKLVTFAAVAAFSVFSASVALAAGTMHKLALQINDNDPAKMNLVLNNAENVRELYKSMGDDVTIEIVAYGPGLKIYTADSPVKERIAAMSLEDPTMQFSACGNTMRKMSKKTGKEVKLLSEAKVVPAGVVRLIELQEQGYSYVKP